MPRKLDITLDDWRPSTSSAVAFVPREPTCDRCLGPPGSYGGVGSGTVTVYGGRAWGVRGAINVGRELVIVGTGGMGREAAAWVADVGRADDLLGFVDDDPDARGGTVAGLPVLGGTSWLDDQADVEVVVGIGTPAVRAAVVDRLDAAGVPLATIVHPSAVVGPRVSLGTGTIVCPGAMLSCDVTVGRAAIVNYGAMVGHDGVLGDGCFVAPGVHLAGNVTIGPRADIGIGASVIQGVAIGADAVVGAGAVVIRDVAAGATVVGVPARPIRGGGT